MSKPLHIDTSKAIVQEIQDPVLAAYNVRLLIKREDLVHPQVSGNKWRKLKYNLIKAKEEGHSALLSFGGAYSNHIYALAAAGKEFGFSTTGVIRGEELTGDNPTLSYARSAGMKLHFTDRTSYKKKNDPEFLNSLREKFGEFYLIPEGGSNELAVTGVEEMVQEIQEPYDLLCAPVGTGGTLAGMISAAKGRKRVIGFPVLKNGDFLKEEITALLKTYYPNWELQTGYHFGGYAKISRELITFTEEFQKNNNITLDPVYTGKMMYGIYDLVKKGHLPSGVTITAIHTGGLQGIEGMKEKLKVLKHE